MKASRGLELAIPKLYLQGTMPYFLPLWEKRTCGGLAVAPSLSAGGCHGVFGQHRLWDDIDEVDATEDAGRLFNPLYSIKLGVVRPDEMESVIEIMTSYLSSEARRVSREMNASGTCELIFAQDQDPPNELYCFVRVESYIH